MNAKLAVAGLILISQMSCATRVYNVESDAEAIKTKSGIEIPQTVESFFQAFRSQRAPYVWGGASVNGADCSGAIQLAFHRSKLADPDWQPHLYMDRDKRYLRDCTRMLMPGDVLLLNYPGREPDHYIVVGDTVSPEGAAKLGGWDKRNSSNWGKYVTRILDQSTDVNGFREIGMTSALANRDIFACKRHSKFAEGYAILAERRKSANLKAVKAQQEAEQQKTKKTLVNPVKSDVVQTAPLPGANRVEVYAENTALAPAQLVLKEGTYSKNDAVLDAQERSSAGGCDFNRAGGRCGLRFVNGAAKGTFVLLGINTSFDSGTVNVELNDSSAIPFTIQVNTVDRVASFSLSQLRPGPFTIRVSEGVNTLFSFNYELIQN